VNAYAEEGEPLIKVRELLDKIDKVRHAGYAFTCDMVTQGGGMIAAPLPRMAGQPQMALGIGGISEVMRQREDQLAHQLLGQIEKRFDVQSRLSFDPPEGCDPLVLAIMRARLKQA
jgi:DNA-binding IclR family transcriptional regulator